MISDDTVRDLIASAYWRGWEACERDRQEDWQRFAQPIAYPERHAREMATHALRLAESSCRREATQRWDRFLADAMSTPARRRTPVQTALLQMYGAA